VDVVNAMVDEVEDNTEFIEAADEETTQMIEDLADSEERDQ
jgi:hypothetical protein